MKLTDGIRYLSQEKGGHVHAFLLDDGKGITLIDALYDSDANLILQEIHEMGRQPSDLKNIIATHAHRSHIGGIAELKKQTNATTNTFGSKPNPNQSTNSGASARMGIV